MQPAAARRPCVLIICTEYERHYFDLAKHLSNGIGLIGTTDFQIAVAVTGLLSRSKSHDLRLVVVDLPAANPAADAVYPRIRSCYHGLIAAIAGEGDDQRRLIELGASTVLAEGQESVRNAVAALTRCSQAPVC